MQLWFLHAYRRCALFPIHGRSYLPYMHQAALEEPHICLHARRISPEDIEIKADMHNSNTRTHIHAHVNAITRVDKMNSSGTREPPWGTPRMHARRERARHAQSRNRKTSRRANQITLTSWARMHAANVRAFEGRREHTTGKVAGFLSASFFRFVSRTRRCERISLSPWVHAHKRGIRASNKPEPNAS